MLAGRGSPARPPFAETKSRRPPMVLTVGDRGSEGVRRNWLDRGGERPEPDEQGEGDSADERDGDKEDEHVARLASRRMSAKETRPSFVVFHDWLHDLPPRRLMQPTRQRDLKRVRSNAEARGVPIASATCR
jgi:hypothetical protein